MGGGTASACCPVCRSTCSERQFEFPDNPWLPGAVHRCRTCGLRFKVPDSGAEAVTKLYGRRDFAEHDYWGHESVAVPVFESILGSIRGCWPDGRGALLDVGCGPGTFAGLAHRAGFQVTGVDLNERLIARARKGSPGTFVVGEVPDVPVPDGGFQIVTLLDVIEHVLDPLALLEACGEVIAPGGSIVVYTPNHSGAIVRIALAVHHASFGRLSGPVTEIFDGPHVTFFDRTSLLRVLAAAGFEVECVQGMRYQPERSNQASGIAAAGVRAIERMSPLLGGPFRLLAMAAAPGDPALAAG